MPRPSKFEILSNKSSAALLKYKMLDVRFFDKKPARI
jgi:hypothetical protein